MEPVSKIVYLPKPRGFCAGVIRAIDIVTIALEKLGRPVYVRKEIVHNRFVVDELAAQGAVFVESLHEVPDGAVTIFSAHGVGPEVWKEAKKRRLRVIDATCPLVTKVHIEVLRYARENYSIILIGHRNHDEVIGTFGEAPDAIHLVSSVADVDALQNINADRVIYVFTEGGPANPDARKKLAGKLGSRKAIKVDAQTGDVGYMTHMRTNTVAIGMLP